MKTIALCDGGTALVDDEDYDKLLPYNWYMHTGMDLVRWYVVRREGNKLIRMHQQIMRVTSGDIDHKDHNGLNNQRNNLRPCSRSQNNMNRRKGAGTTSKYKGVWWSVQARKWCCIITKNYRKHYLGCYYLEDDAARAYNKAAIELFGEFALLNAIVDEV